jgi:hypothetical protein
VRAVLIGAGFAAAAAVAFGVSQAFDGFVGAAAFMLALFVLPVAVGMAIGSHLNAAPHTPRKTIRSVAARTLEGADSALGRCRTCGGTRSLSGAVWVCARCDHA